MAVAGYSPNDSTGVWTPNSNLFAKCSPAISSNIKECGTVTQCSAKPMTEGDLSTTFMKSGQFRVMEALFHHDFEIKMCETVQNGMYDFMMANKVSLAHKMRATPVETGLIEIAPFVKGRQYSPINNEYWIFSNGSINGSGQLVGRVTSSVTAIPNTTQNFPIGLRVFIQGKSTGGSAIRTAWIVAAVSLANDGTYVSVTLTGDNTASRLYATMPDKLQWPIAGVGILTRGTPNVSDYEKWCSEAPTYLNWKNVPFWCEFTRDSHCSSELYRKAKKFYLTNPFYKEFFDLPEVEKNKQIAADFQKRLVQQMFWGKPLPNQTTTGYDQLADVTLPYIGPAGAGTNSTASYMGAGYEGRCVGKRANMVGIYEQHGECGRILDLQGGVLNIPALAKALYNMMRVRKSNGSKNPMVFDLFGDSVFAELFNQAMLDYYQAKSNGLMRLTVNGEGFSVAKKADFGFYYRTYSLFWPQGITINIITHEFFDDWITAMDAADTSGNSENTARALWILDFGGIYPGILASNRVTNKTGDLKTMAAVSTDAACVMQTPSIEWTHTSMLMTMVCECPLGNLIIENFAATKPSVTTVGGLDYDLMAAGSGGQSHTTQTIPLGGET